MADGKSDGMDPWLRMSAWLPAGLALGGLAVLATFVHGVASLLIIWGATVFLAVVIIALLAGLRRIASSRSRSKTVGSPAAQQGLLPDERTGNNTAQSASATENAATSLSHSSDSPSGPSSRAEPVPSGNATTSVRNTPASSTAGPTGQLEIAEIAVPLGLRVLTATEVASVLRVDIDVIITAIGNGELPGNRIGNHWWVDLGALTRWLQGTYEYISNPRSPSPAEPETDETEQPKS